MNGTTNFMLTKMAREGMDFDAALKIAQQLGYAETRDPGDDVDGRDACRKIAILSSMVCGHHIYPQNIPTRGIRGYHQIGCGIRCQTGLRHQAYCMDETPPEGGVARA